MKLLPKPIYFDNTVWGVDTWKILSAAFAGDIDTVTHFLDKDSSNINVQFAYYEPLHYAVRGGDIEMVNLLVKRGGHPKAKGWLFKYCDDTPLGKAIDRERQDIVEILTDAAKELQEWKWPEEKPQTSEEKLIYKFELACGGNRSRHVRKVLKKQPELATRGLYEAVHHGHLDLIQYLLSEGADVNGHMPWSCWYTPLMHALRKDKPRFEIAQLLLDNGVFINATNGLGMTALHIIALAGNIESANWLIDNGANVNAIEQEFCSSPLGWAAKWGHIELAKLLISYGAEINLPNSESWTQPLSWAQKNNHQKLVRLLT